MNAALVGEGIAWHYKRYSKSNELAQAQSKATDKKLGLWLVNNPVPPWQFRKRGTIHVSPFQGQTGF